MQRLRNYWNRWGIKAALGLLLVQMPCWAWAAVINVDFQPGPIGDGWAAAYTGQGAYPDPGNNTWNIVAPSTDGSFNPWGSGGYYNSNVVVSSLVDSSGAATGVGLTVYADSNTPPNNTGAFATSGTNTYIAQNAINLARDYIIAFNSTTQRIEITGLNPTGWYDLYLYGSGDHPIRRTLFEITGANLTSQNLRTRGVPGVLHNLQKGNDYVVASGIRPTAGGMITVYYTTAGNSGNAEGVFNGFQLVQRTDIYQVLISDQFDQGGPISNPSGIGAGFEYKDINPGIQDPAEGLYGGAPAEGFLIWARNANWCFGGLSSKDVWKPVPAVTAHARWTHQRVYVDADQTATYPQFPGGEQADFRIEYGLVSANRAVTGNNDLYNNTSGGLYVNLFYEREASATNLTLTGNIRATTKNKPVGDTEGLTGLVTLATFRLGNVAGITGGDFGQILDVIIDADLNGWRVSFADQNGPITPTVLSGSLSGGWTNLSSVIDGETISFTDEFLNGVFLFAGAQGMGAGRGSAVFDSVFVYLTVPEPNAWALFGLGGLLLVGLGYRRLRR
ncbi:MAG: PEP-CTERM sorting domain-containing protein [Thermoguttaceae bacterium]|nr:PEP-CTERM sorting domain-containing protein [Thermoguttaceae bacterium]MDW8038189.1 PEP-CTERM sorting domain-containing protein [Thermoguttaceae bacterium]